MIEPKTTRALAIRRAEGAADIAQVRELLVEYQSALGVDLGFQGFAEELASLPGHYAAPIGRLLLASGEECALGVGCLRSAGGTDCELKRLYVRPAGRGLGLGRSLTARLIHEARLEGYSRILLDTLPCMTEAHALYRSMGFTPIGAYRHNPIAGAQFMALDLQGG